MRCFKGNRNVNKDIVLVILVLAEMKQIMYMFLKLLEEPVDELLFFLNCNSSHCELLARY